MKFKKVTIIGLGYIGLPTAAIFARSGLQVTGVDVNQQIVETINGGNIHIVEPLLHDIVRQEVHRGTLKASTKPVPADAFVIAVPTPVRKVGTELAPNLSFIIDAITGISACLEPGNLVVLESTSPVGTTEMIMNKIMGLRPDLVDDRGKLRIFVAYCPERVLPGNIIFELENNARIIGGITDESALHAQALYENFLKAPVKLTDAKTAEMVKLTENASRDSQLAFANQLSILCDKLEVDVFKLIELANMHPRVNILQPGTGVGGHCIAVDPWFLVHNNHLETKFMIEARHTNIEKETWVFDKCKKFINNHPGRRVICMGLAFKPNIDDLRESPSLSIAKRLYKLFSDKLVCCEPNIPEENIHGMRNIKTDQINEHDDILLLFVAHKEFSNFAKSNLFLDFCGLRQ